MASTDRIASPTPRLAQDDKEIEARRTRNMIVTLVILAAATVAAIYFIATDEGQQPVAPYTQESSTSGQNAASMDAAGEEGTIVNNTENVESPTGATPAPATTPAP